MWYNVNRVGFYLGPLLAMERCRGSSKTNTLLLSSLRNCVNVVSSALLIIVDLLEFFLFNQFTLVLIRVLEGMNVDTCVCSAVAAQNSCIKS